MSTSRQFRRLAITALVLFGLTGCYRHTGISPSMAAQQIELRLTLHDGRQLVIRDPLLHGDSIYGTPWRSGQVAGDPRSTALAVSDIARFERRDLNGVTAVATTVAVGMALLLLLTSQI